MLGVIGVITVLVVLCLSLVITRLATVALMSTGLSEQAARFQARSAFTGTGFTTGEAESVVDHPVRRRIVMWLMILRSAGVISIIISLILSFTGEDTDQTKLMRLIYIAGGAVVVWLLARSQWVDKAMRHVMQWLLERWTDLDTRDYVGLLNLSGPCTVRELAIRDDDWLARQRLGECRLTDEGVVVLGIYRNDGSYVGVPKDETRIEPGDTLVLYGRAEPLRELDQRKPGAPGDEAHARAVSEQRHEEARQDEQEERSRQSRDRGQAERGRASVEQPQSGADDQPDERAQREDQ